MMLRRAQPGESRDVAAWLAERHYLRSSPPGYVAAFELVERGQRVGAILLGRPASREIDADRVLEVTRVFLDDSLPANSESAALAMLRRHIRKWFPSIRLLISYSDPEQGHVGTIYAADGWAPFGRTKGRAHSWNSRSGRRNSPNGAKLRWVRTP